jgi:hypothetical protein
VHPAVDSQQPIANSCFATANSWLATANSWLPTANSWLATANSWLATANGWLATANGWLATANGWLATANSWLPTANSWLATANSWLATAKLLACNHRSSLTDTGDPKTNPICSTSWFFGTQNNHILHLALNGNRPPSTCSGCNWTRVLQQFEFKSAPFSQAVFLFIFFGSFAVGCLVGMVTALTMKFTKIGDFPQLETALFVLLSLVHPLVSFVCFLF